MDLDGSWRCMNSFKPKDKVPGLDGIYSTSGKVHGVVSLITLSTLHTNYKHMHEQLGIFISTWISNEETVYCIAQEPASDLFHETNLSSAD